MAKLFIRELPQELNDYRRDLASGRKLNSSDVHEQFKSKIKNLHNNYINSLISLDDKCVTENDLLSRTDELKIMDDILDEENKKKCKLCSKIQALKLYNNDLKDNIKKNKSKFVQLECSLTSAQMQLLQKTDNLIKAHRLNLVFYNVYKTYFGFKIYFESPHIVRLEFAPEIYIKLQSENWKSNWCLIDIKPAVENRYEIEEKLIETDNIQSFLANLYRSFQPLFGKLKLLDKV